VKENVLIETNSNDIAVIGISCRFPESDNIDKFWQNLIDGNELIQRFDKNKLFHLNVDEDLLNHKNYINACGYLEEIDKFDNEFFKISALEAAAMDPQQRLFLEEAYHALEDAGYTSEKYNGKIGVYAGSGPTQYYNELIKNNYFNKHPQSRQLLHYLGNEKDFLALRVAYALNLTGPAININLASATGLAVVIKACQSLVNGEADMMLAGACSVILPNQFGYVYEPDNIFSVDGHCRPFDKDSTGTVLGSGIGVVVLKRLTDAINDNDSIHAVIKGYAINNDGNHKIGFTAPSIAGQSTCFKDALSMSNVNLSDIKFIEMHGTGTYLGDPIETTALSQGFSEHVNQGHFCAIGSVKSNIGHAQSAAGIAGFIKLVLTLKNKLIPPSLNFNSLNPRINFSESPFYVNSKLKKWDDNIRVGGVNSLAMGGVNTHIIAENYRENSVEIEERNECNVMVLSANTDIALAHIKRNMTLYLKSLPKERLDNKQLFHSVAYTLQVGRKDLPKKSAYICNSLNDFLHKISSGRLENSADNDNAIHLLNIKNKWLSGGKIAWEELYTKKPRKLSLPNYPFEKNKHWLLEKNQKSKINEAQEKVANNEGMHIKCIIEQLIEMWKESLQLKMVNYEDDFETLGGDSLLAIDLITKIEKKFNVKISIDDFIRHKNIINIASHILKNNGHVSLKEKLNFLTEKNESAPSVFIVHPGNGELYFYQGIADILNNQLNLIGIENNVYNDIDEENGSITISSLATRYINLIKTHQPFGPYFLCGWSLGGVIAFEMAHQLIMQGESIQHLFIIDSWAKYSSRFNNADYFFNTYLIRNNNKLLLNDTGLWGKLLWKRMEALFNYEPQLINAKVTLLKADSINDEYIDINAFDNHWQQYCHRPVSTILINGNHETILQFPGLAILASTIKNAITRNDNE